VGARDLNFDAFRLAVRTLTSTHAHEDLTDEELLEDFYEIDTNKSGTIGFHEVRVASHLFPLHAVPVPSVPSSHPPLCVRINKHLSPPGVQLLLQIHRRPANHRKENHRRRRAAKKRYDTSKAPTTTPTCACVNHTLLNHSAMAPVNPLWPHALSLMFSSSPCCRLQVPKGFFGTLGDAKKAEITLDLHGHQQKGPKAYTEGLTVDDKNKEAVAILQSKLLRQKSTARKLAANEKTLLTKKKYSTIEPLIGSNLCCGYLLKFCSREFTSENIQVRFTISRPLYIPLSTPYAIPVPI
jgi:hypothetical protein